jgi:hypothetical protein
LKEIPTWFDQMLDYCLLPALQKIGFDDPISKVLFKIAPSSWNLMGPLNEKVVAFHPVINQQVKDVRHGLKLNAGKKNEMFQFTVEFFGNFSLKFAERHHPPDQLTKLLFYGYSALFWKNLRCPPENLENRAVFEYFFRWLCNLRSKKDFLGKEERRAVRCMIKMKKMAFPGKNFNRPQIRGKPDISPFIITLRHGYIGIATILKYFGIDQFLDSRQTGKRFACPSVQNEVQSLLNIIQTKFHLESKQTKENIKLFINCLRSAYSQMQTSFHPTMNKFLNIKFNNLQISLDT